MISQKQLEEARSKVLSLIRNCSLIVIEKTEYDKADLKEICENWSQVSDKIKQAQDIAHEVIAQIIVENIPCHP